MRSRCQPAQGRREGRRKAIAEGSAILPAQRAAAPCGRSSQEVDGTPPFDILPLNEARANSATGQRAALLQEYIGYIQRVAPGQAGKLEPREGETTQAVRHKLNAAAEALGKDLEVRRSANAVNFWTPDGRRRGQAPQGVGRVASRRVSLTRPRACSLIGSSCCCLTSFLHAGWAIAMKNCGTRGR